MRAGRLVALLTFLVPVAYGQTILRHDEFQKFFNEANVEGSFCLYDATNNKFVLCNKKQFTQKFIPASTFKICNSLIGLETGVIGNEHFVIKWDSVKRQIESWNADQDLKTAYKNSCVPYYQELARRVGGERMKYWLDKSGYGNADTSGGIDMFWLRGGLRISPEQQLSFLRRLNEEKVPFSKRSIDIVKTIMIEEQTSTYTLRAKTGLAGWMGNDRQHGKDVGWYVGYVTKGDSVFYFATCIQSSKPGPDFAKSRKSITRKILTQLHILPK